MSWHNEYFEEMGWFEELRQRKIDAGLICGLCGEWPDFCGCEEPEDGTMEGCNEHREGDV